MIEDQQLLSDLKNEKKQQQAFHILVDKYKERLYWHIRKIVLNHDDADDVLQETFIKIWKNIHSFRADSGLYTWLYRIATNESLSFLSQKKRKYINNSEEINDYLIDNLKADPYFSGDEIQMKLQMAIAQLPEKQRLVFNMRYFDEVKYQDMSKIMGTSEGALKASFHHAMKKIEAFLKDEE